jgi:uncharacterized protein
MKKLVFCMIFLVFISSIGFSQQIPTLQKYVNDYANVLSSSEESRINSLAATIEENTTVQIAILTIDSTQPMSIEEYAVEAFEKAGIGYKDKDNGLLIVVAISDRKWRIEVGYGLEPIINDAKAGLIGRTYMTTAFREERYGDGLYDAVDAVYKVIQNSGDTSFISEQSEFETVIPWIIVMMLIFIMIPLIVFAILSISRCPKCGTRMKCQTKGDYIICECPKCGKKIRKKKKRRHFWFFYVGGFGGHGGGGGGGGFGGGGSGGGGASGGF